MADDIELQHEFLKEKAILLNFLKQNRSGQGDPNWNELIEKGFIKKDHLLQVLYSVEMDKDGFYFDPIDIEPKTMEGVDFKGMAEENKKAAYLLMNGGINTNAIIDFRDATECRIKAVLNHDKIFDQKQDTHHNLRKLAAKAGLNLKKETLEFLQSDPAFQHTKLVNVNYSGTRTVVPLPGQVDEKEAMENKVTRCMEICEEVWRASASRLE